MTNAELRQLPHAEFERWFQAETRRQGPPARRIPAGKWCRYCGRTYLHEVTCRNPWDLQAMAAAP